MKTIRSVSTSNAPEKAKPTAQAPTSNTAFVGTREPPDILANVAGRRPSRAIAKGTRATVRLVEWREPKVESIIPTVSKEAPPAPNIRTMTAPATEEASGKFDTANGLKA